MQLTLTDLILGGTGKIPGGKVHMMFVILCNFKGGDDFDYSILLRFHKLSFLTSQCNLAVTLCVLYTHNTHLLTFFVSL